MIWDLGDRSKQTKQSDPNTNPQLHAVGAESRSEPSCSSTSKQSARERLSEYLQGMSLRKCPTSEASLPDSISRADH